MDGGGGDRSAGQQRRQTDIGVVRGEGLEHLAGDMDVVIQRSRQGWMTTHDATKAPEHRRVEQLELSRSVQMLSVK